MPRGDLSSYPLLLTEIQYKSAGPTFFPPHAPLLALIIMALLTAPVGSSSSRPPQAHRMCVSLLEDIAGPPLQNGTTQDVFQTIVKGRKSWKTLRGGEIVWPPELEAALLEGLETYQPDDSRETRLLGRFPMRNRFISDFIFSKTGKRRTAKQVGSRLQQLRDTCAGKRLLSLLSPRHRGIGSSSSSRMYSSLRKCNTSSKGRLPTLSCDVSPDSDSSSVGSPISPTDGDMLRTGVPPCSREGSVDPLPARAEITRPEGVSVSLPRW